MNKVTLLGNFTKDPEVRQTQNGNAVVNFSIATSERYKDKSGEWVDKAEFHNCVAFSGKGEAIGRFFHKGSKILIEGKLQTRTWDDKDGNKRYTTEVVIKDFYFCERKGEGGGRQDSPAGYGAHTQVVDNSGGGNVDMTITDNDIPF